MNPSKKFNKSLKRTIIIWSLVLSILPLLVLSFTNYQNSKKIVESRVKLSIGKAGKVKYNELHFFIEQIIKDLKFHSSRITVKKAVKALQTSYNANTKGTLNELSSSIKSITDYQAFYNHSQKFIKNMDYYDMFLISKEGNILFSVSEEEDLYTNILTGRYSKSKFGAGCRKALAENRLILTDLEFYEPSKGKLAFFAIAPIFNDKNNSIGLIAFQIPMKKIVEAINDDQKYSSDNTFIIGEDLLLRTDNDKLKNGELKSQIKNELSISWQKNHQKDNKDSALHLNSTSKEYINHKGTEVIGILIDLDFLHPYDLHWCIISEEPFASAFESINHLRNYNLFVLLITMIIVALIALFFSTKLIKPINLLSEWSRSVANGDLTEKETPFINNELGEMLDNFKYLTVHLKEITTVVEFLALSKFDKKVKVKSQNDKLSLAINKTAVTLRDNQDRIINEMWLRAGETQLNDLMKGERKLILLLKDIIAHLVNYTTSDLGAFYLIEDDHNLILKTSHAFFDRQGNFNSFKLGEGLVGQCGLEQTPIYFSNPEIKDTPLLNNGIERIKTKNVALLPILFNEKLLGVILLGSINPLSEASKEFLNKSLLNIGIAIAGVQEKDKTYQLLKKTQEQKEELNAQQEELRQSNEELRNQQEELKQSNEELIQQKQQLHDNQEKLKTINKELEDKTVKVEEKNLLVEKKNDDLKLIQKKLAVKAEKLEIASKYKSEFLANMSHELRTPLNSILVLSQLLAENGKNNLDAKQLEFAQTINTSGNDLLELINEILDLSKVEAGRMELQYQKVEIASIVKELNLYFAELAKKNNIQFITEIDSKLPKFILTDEFRLKQIIKNLLSNAFKFTSSGFVKLSFSKVPENIDIDQKIKDPFIISVQDSGTGIPEDKKDLIFEAFQQVDGSISRKYGGTGLGLSISRALTAAFGGEMMLESIAGEGSTFSIVLPLKTSKRAADIGAVVIKEVEQIIEPLEVTPDLITSKSEEITVEDDGKNRILIIEDDPRFSKLLGEIATEKGFEAVICGDGKTGLQEANKQHFKAILLDLGLPDIDGEKVLQQLKQSKLSKKVPVHVISARDSEKNLIELGAVGFIAKPVSLNNLNKLFKDIEEMVDKETKNVLLVEDDKVLQNGLTELFNSINIKTDAVSKGSEALKLLKKKQFEVVILDFGLEDTTGLKLLYSIKKEFSKIPFAIIVYTGRELSEDEERELSKYTESIIIKGSRSVERLLAETKLFLHKVGNKKSDIEVRDVMDDNIFKDKKILIVDDDMRNIFALSNLLESRGIKVIIGKNGKVGIEKLKENPDADLVLMDIMMPEMDGYQAMRIIKKDNTINKIPIIALTAKAMKGDREKCIKEGASDYLAKPIDNQKLLSMIRVWLKSI